MSRGFRVAAIGPTAGPTGPAGLMGRVRSGRTRGLCEVAPPIVIADLSNNDRSRWRQPEALTRRTRTVYQDKSFLIQSELARIRDCVIHSAANATAPVAFKLRHFVGRACIPCNHNRNSTPNGRRTDTHHIRIVKQSDEIWNVISGRAFQNKS